MLQVPFERDLATVGEAPPIDLAPDGTLKLDQVPYSPRWTPEDMVNRFVKHLALVVPQYAPEMDKDKP